jgi:hypothetical protein
METFLSEQPHQGRDDVAATMKKTRENKFQISLPNSLVTEKRHKKVLVVVHWASIFRPYAKCFACAVIHTKRHTGLDLRFRAIHNVGTI